MHLDYRSSLTRKTVAGLILCFAALLFGSPLTETNAAELLGRIVDADSGKTIPARIYVQNEAGEFLFVTSADPKGSAFPYREQWVPMAGAVELHTTISAHPFHIDLKPGRYKIEIEHGKEYLPLKKTIEIGKADREETFRLQRFVNLAKRGWYSGETHVHRRHQELPNVMLAEDLNVAFPVTFWTIEAFKTPGLSPSTLRRQGPSPFGDRLDRGSKMIEIDRSHVIFPRNTEYEIFQVGDTRHVLGAIFILNHKTVFKQGMPPVQKIAEQAHREGALLDLDKHNWPWSMMLVPVAKVDLYELSNNSVWRTNFKFSNSRIAPAEYMHIKQNDRGMTEFGWLNFGFENYYTLLNCGFKIQPTAGTASGVHPVPLGHSRVYVHLDGPFDGQKWIEGLRQGNSFVSTGPLLLAKVNEQHPGFTFKQTATEKSTYRITGRSISSRPIDRVEILINGEQKAVIKPNAQTKAKRNQQGAYELPIDITLPVERSSWIVVRSFEKQPDGRIRFAHTAPWRIEVGSQPIRPRREEINYLISRVQAEIKRNEKLLPEASLNEFRQALKIYQEIAKEAR